MTTLAGWAKWEGDGREWDRTLLELEDFNLYQSWGWGLHRAKFGWSPTPFVFFANGIVTSMAMALIRRNFGVMTICWIPGGPVGDLESSCSSLINAVKSATKTLATYVHISPMAQFSENTSNKLRASAWQRPPKSLSSGKTLVYSSFRVDSDRRALLSKNWERNLTRGERRSLVVSEWHSATGKEIADITNQMRDYKKIADTSDVTEIADSLMRVFGNQVLLVRCTDTTGTTLAIRGVIKYGRKAYDMFSAASPAGRKEYASNLCLWKIIELCARDGVTHFDLSGVDPEANQGVYNFKKGIGALDFNYQGEWTLSRPQIFGSLISRMISRRLRA